jgi:hypothetical protein
VGARLIRTAVQLAALGAVVLAYMLVLTRGHL